MIAQHEIRTFPRRTVAPSQSPVTISQAQLALDLGDSPENNDEIEDLIRTATAMVEQHSMRALMRQTYELTLDSFPCEIELRRPPVDAESIVIKYTLGGVETTLSAADYTVDATTEPPRIQPVTVWPSPDDVMNAVKVTFEAGFDSPQEMVDGAQWGIMAQRAVLLACKALYGGCEVGKAYWDCVSWLYWGGQV